MTMKSVLHYVRDIAVRSTTLRPFKAIQSPARRIVVVRPDHFGDLLMLVPALRLLEKHAVTHEVSLMVGPWNRSVAKHLATECKILQFPFPGFVRSDNSRSVCDPYRQIARGADLLRSCEPEVVVIMRDDHWWGAWMAREAGIPVRIGYNTDQVRRFLSHPIDMPETHYVAQNLELARWTLGMLGYDVPLSNLSSCDHPLEWPVDHASQLMCQQLLDEHGISSPYAVVHPGTGAPVKLWTADRWAAVVDCLSNEAGLPVLLTGSSDEHDLCHQIATASGTSPVNLAGKSSLFMLAELLRSSTLVLGVDSGPLHLATAVGSPSIHLYGPSDPVRYGPWGDPSVHKAITAGMFCPRCGDLSATRPAGSGCMMAITSEQVSRSAIEIVRHAG